MTGQIPEATLGALLNTPDLELAFAPGASLRYRTAPVAGLLPLHPDGLRGGVASQDLKDGFLVLITEPLATYTEDGLAAAMTTLLHQMSRCRCAALVMTWSPGTAASLPSAATELSAELGVPLMLTRAGLHHWLKAFDKWLDRRTEWAEHRVEQLNALLQHMPARLTDSTTMQRITEWLAATLGAQVIVSQTNGVLAAVPATAAADIGQAIISKTADSGSRPTPHTHVISLTPQAGSGAILAVARSTVLDEADKRLLRHAAKVLGLVDQAQRDSGLVTYGSQSAYAAAMELLLSGEVDRARSVLAPLAPRLLCADSARVFVIDVTPECRDTAVRLCTAAVADQALVVGDPRTPRRILVMQSIALGEECDDAVAVELARLVNRAPDASLGGSGLYPLSLLADAMQEAIAAQRSAVGSPNSVALPSQCTDLVRLLPRREAQTWSHDLLRPLLEPGAQWCHVRKTLAVALAYPYTVAARRLDLHRNTVARHVSQAAHMLSMNFNSVSDRIATSLALEVHARQEQQPRITAGETEPPTLESLVAAPQVGQWAAALLAPACADRRQLLATATSWLANDTCIEPTARGLSLSEATVRSHLRALEHYTNRNLNTLSGQRDLQIALHVHTGKPKLLHGPRNKPASV
ncbi:helix-turn-helix domain-containing protein [Streptomyces aureocirculatus]|uniref:helix-turn-helix domain-containing protein n=1 Tax=Streptomyces aureocirculatus TaxID=67275 RepID=UPI0004C6CE5A|nr:helix-turn-helix domain-containing protein [Streptomyces aureocirculatus]